ncbi:STAS domain-containing protein [Tistrella bauzanensis]|uniref:Anti-sigma factor antagonist n=1 Tax=Tistrella arctica TaxID=3133430 RepID=A0ABU9YHQ5_9PROT
MQIERQSTGTVVILGPKGRLDGTSCPAFEAEVLDALDASSGRLAVDLAGLDYISSAGLRVLLIAAKRSKASGGKVVLSGMRPEIREVFDISGFSAIFAIFATRDEAVATFG